MNPPGYLNNEYYRDNYLTVTNITMPGLLRLIIIGLIVWLAYRLIKRWQSSLSSSKSDTPSEIETMVQCQHCGLHIPKKEAIESHNEYYCSREHQRLSQDDS